MTQVPMPCHAMPCHTIPDQTDHALPTLPCHTNAIHDWAFLDFPSFPCHHACCQLHFQLQLQLHLHPSPLPFPFLPSLFLSFFFPQPARLSSARLSSAQLSCSCHCIRSCSCSRSCSRSQLSLLLILGPTSAPVLFPACALAAAYTLLLFLPLQVQLLLRLLSLLLPPSSFYSCPSAGAPPSALPPLCLQLPCTFSRRRPRPRLSPLTSTLATSVHPRAFSFSFSQLPNILTPKHRSVGSDKTKSAILFHQHSHLYLPRLAFHPEPGETEAASSAWKDIPLSAYFGSCKATESTRRDRVA